MKISICLACCNGEKFIERQLASILSQTRKADEIILVDDCSDDNTVAVAKKVLSGFSVEYRIEVNPIRMGVNATFSKAVNMASGELLVFSDQDDYWFEHRLEKIFAYMETNPRCELALVNAQIERKGVVTGETINDIYMPTTSVYKNVIKNSYTGCQMSIRKSLSDRVMPYAPDAVCYYDHWIALHALLQGSVAILPEPLGYYCRHGSNVTDFTTKRSIFTVLKARTLLMFLLLKKISGFK